jgi:hypothetical protein
VVLWNKNPLNRKTTLLSTAPERCWLGQFSSCQNTQYQTLGWHKFSFLIGWHAKSESQRISGERMMMTWVYTEVEGEGNDVANGSQLAWENNFFVSLAYSSLLCTWTKTTNWTLVLISSTTILLFLTAPDHQVYISSSFISTFFCVFMFLLSANMSEVCSVIAEMGYKFLILTMTTNNQ